MTTLIAYTMVPALLLGGQGSTSSGFTKWQSALNSKESISAKVIIQTVGGTSNAYTIDLKKPNIARIENESELVIADGTSITTLDKKGKIWYKRPQTSEDFNVMLSEEKYSLFSGFFGIKPKTVKTTDGASRTLGNETVTEVKAILDKTGKKTASFYVGTDGIAKRSAVAADSKVKPGEKVQIITSASDVVVNGKASADLFAFKAPSGATEIDYQDLIASKWFSDLDEAKLIASRTKKNIFIDFMASWCGPCKMMDKNVFVTDDFKSLSKQLVFCKIDIDMNPVLAEQYGVEAIPNMFVIRPDGSVVGSILGYHEVSEFMAEMNRILGNNR